MTQIKSLHNTRFGEDLKGNNNQNNNNILHFKEYSRGGFKQ